MSDFVHFPRQCSYNCLRQTQYSWFRCFLVENQTFLERHHWDASANVNEWHFEQNIMSLFRIYNRHQNDFNCATCKPLILPSLSASYHGNHSQNTTTHNTHQLLLLQ